MKKLMLTAFFLSLCTLYSNAQPKQISLKGSCLFAFNPLKSGENICWTKESLPDKVLNKIILPFYIIHTKDFLNVEVSSGYMRFYTSYIGTSMFGFGF